MTILTEPNIRNFLLRIIMIRAKELIEESAHNAQFSHDEIPKVETIRNWVSRYSAEMKRDVADKMLTTRSLAKGIQEPDLGEGCVCVVTAIKK
ncbi:10098_t:CDS:2 [Entrophospora sp. SA101]|nr:10098_t:CDS:2 [Entrophospora sp. SA101]